MLGPIALRRSTAARANSGFTLIELLIVLMILGIALTLAMPSYRQWIQNTHIRNTAESVLHGMQRARAEAVSRNTTIAFNLTPGGGVFWSVTFLDDANNPVAIESRPSDEVPQSVKMTPHPIPVGSETPPTTLTYSNLGGIVPNADGSTSITQIDVDSDALPAEDSRDLRIVVGVGGMVRMCDPNVTSASDPRHC